MPGIPHLDLKIGMDFINPPGFEDRDRFYKSKLIDAINECTDWMHGMGEMMHAMNK